MIFIRILFCAFLLANFRIVNGQDIEKGIVITHKNDSVTYKFRKLKNRDAAIAYRSLSFIDSLGNIKALFPKSISGYIKNGVFYKSASFGDLDIFMRLITTGKVSLYYSEFANGGKYIFKKETERSFNAISSSLETTDGAISQREFNLPVINSEQAFKAFFSGYFNDCLIIKRKIESGFFKLDDLESLFIDYNNEMKK